LRQPAAAGSGGVRPGRGLAAGVGRTGGAPRGPGRGAEGGHAGAGVELRLRLLPAEAGVPQHLRQRPGGLPRPGAGRGPLRASDAERPARRAGGGARRRAGPEPRAAATHLRPVLHDQDQGHRARHGNCKTYCRGPRRRDPRRGRVTPRGRDCADLTDEGVMTTIMSPLRVAVADDEKDMLEFFQEALPRLGHEVVAVAETGKQLVQRALEAKPDLVITDIKMPDMDGIEAVQQIERERPVPVILVSAHHDAELIVRAGTDHVMAYLLKPVREADLSTAIYLAVLRFEHFQKLAREAANLRQAMEDRKLIERAKGILMKRARIDEPEAFRRLQRLASDKNKKLVEVAQIILLAEEAFSPAEHRPVGPPSPHPARAGG